MRNRHSMITGVSAVVLPYLIFMSLFPGSILSAVVTLKSIEIYNLHQWLPRKPAIYFKCSGENKISLPDVQKADVLYTFKGEESWQPLTKLLTKKCKRCGIYEDLVGDHVFDVWELCCSDFTAPDGYYTRSKEKEYNATFLCKECLSLVKVADFLASMEDLDRGTKKLYVIPVLVTVTIMVVVAVATVVIFRYWQGKLVTVTIVVVVAVAFVAIFRYWQKKKGSKNKPRSWSPLRRRRRILGMN